MKTNHRLAWAVLAGITLGVPGAAAIHAQQVKPLPAYVIAEIDVSNLAASQKYSAHVPGTLAPFDGHYLVRGGKTQSLEGEPPKRVVVIAFDSMEKAQAWEDSPTYDAIKPIRHSSATSRVFLAEGLAPQ